MLDRTDVEATFVPGELPRKGHLAFWRTDEAVDGADSEIELVLPAGSRLRRRRVPARRLAMIDAIDALVELPGAAEVRPSLRAWATAAHLAVNLVARGRVLPGCTAGGQDCWRVGPLDPADLTLRRQMADALPTAAHATRVPGRGRLRVASPTALIEAFTDAVGDTLVRTAAAPLSVGQGAFASTEGTDVGDAAGWLATAAAGSTEQASTALRLVLPLDLDDAMAVIVQLQSHRDPSLVVDAADLWAAPDIVLSRFGDDIETELLLALRRGSRVWPPLVRLLDEARPGRIDLSDDEVDELLGPVADELAGAGIAVLWPAELLRAVELRPVLSTPAPAAVTSAGLTLESLTELRWRATVDGEELTDAELAMLADAKRPMVRLRGRWVRADPARLARLKQRRELSTAEALSAALGGPLVIDGESVDAEVEGPLAGLADRLRSFDGERRAPVPDGLEAVLRPYQERGLAWLAEMADLGLGGVLADDMGLGKTIQVLALHLHLHGGALAQPSGPTLVVCPATLIGNWEREAARFAPGIAVRRFHGADRTLDDLTGHELVVVTYGVVRRDADALADVAWGLVVADEAQAVKNPLSRTARALRRIPGRARFALTGTPVENRLSDLWALLDWTTPGLLGPLDRFRADVAVPVERHRDVEAATSLARLIRPFLLRRRKSDPLVAPELPPKTETDRFVSLTDEQVTLYEATVAETLDQVRQAEGIARRGLVLKLLTALKQICNHPAHYLAQPGPLPGRSGKLDAVTELVEVVAAEGEAALVFTQYVAMGRLLHGHLADRGVDALFLHGSVPVGQRQALIDRFQAGEAPVFILSLKAGGTGLNLTRATHVVHYDRWWNPAVEDQASDRAWRIGQDRPVQVHRLMCERTLEERIATVLTAKRELADAVVGAGEAWVSELSDDDLAELVSLSGAGAGT